MPHKFLGKEGHKKTQKKENDGFYTSSSVCAEEEKVLPFTLTTPYSQNGRHHQKHQCRSRLVTGGPWALPGVRSGWVRHSSLALNGDWQRTFYILWSFFYPTAISPANPRPGSAETAVAAAQAPCTQHAHTPTINVTGPAKGGQPHLQGSSEGQSSPK